MEQTSEPGGNEVSEAESEAKRVTGAVYEKLKLFLEQNGRMDEVKRKMEFDVNEQMWVSKSRSLKKKRVRSKKNTSHS